MSNTVIALLVGLIIGSIFAIYVVRKSSQEDKIYSGGVAQVFHFLGALGFCMTLPTVITSVILHSGFIAAFLLGMGCVLAAFIALLIYAVVERPARAGIAPVEEVWTEEKARSSGL
jgi:hypothetical protein